MLSRSHTWLSDSFPVRRAERGIYITHVTDMIIARYMVYIGMNGEAVTTHLQPKDTLDIMRHLAKGKSIPDKKLCDIFNRATHDGRNMEKVSRLLEDSIMTIIDAKDEGDIDSFFSGGQTTFLSGGFSGLDDFELICFMVVIE